MLFCKLDTFAPTVASTLGRFWVTPVIWAALLISPLAVALDSDRQQPLQIAADTAELNEGKGFSIYTGNVIITQGSMIIEAEKVKVTFNDNGIQTLTATKGKHDGRAYMRQQMEPVSGDTKTSTNDLMEAWGESIDYNIVLELLALQGDAKLIQRGDTFSGHEISFDMPKDSVKATGGTSGRVQMIFLPKSK